MQLQRAGHYMISGYNGKIKPNISCYEFHIKYRRHTILYAEHSVLAEDARFELTIVESKSTVLPLH